MDDTVLTITPAAALIMQHEFRRNLLVPEPHFTSTTGGDWEKNYAAILEHERERTERGHNAVNTLLTLLGNGGTIIGQPDTSSVRLEQDGKLYMGVVWRDNRWSTHT